MTGEQEVLAAIMARLDALLEACDEDRQGLGKVPADLADFRAMPSPRRIASRALLKTVEQLQDQLARLFRLLPRLLLVDTAGWYAQDYANHAERLGVLADAFAWSEIVRLRNRLVHDYPLDPEARLQALQAAHAAIPILEAAVRDARAFVNQQVFPHD